MKDQEDLISIGTIGLIKAASTFDYEKGTRFATYASRCIENATLLSVDKFYHIITDALVKVADVRLLSKAFKLEIEI